MTTNQVSNLTYPFSKMSWTSKGEEVQMALKNYATQLGAQRRIDLSTTYDKAMAPFQGSWKTLDRITYVNLRNQRNVLENLSLATLKEMMGLGPCLYCVLRSYNSEFESFLILALHYLSNFFFCIYPL